MKNKKIIMASVIVLILFGTIIPIASAQSKPGDSKSIFSINFPKPIQNAFTSFDSFLGSIKIQAKLAWANLMTLLSIIITFSLFWIIYRVYPIYRRNKQILQKIVGKL